MLNLQNLAKQTFAFSRYLLLRVKHDRVNVNAGIWRTSLCFLLCQCSLFLRNYVVFEIFANVGEVLQDFVIEHFVPLQV